MFPTFSQILIHIKTKCCFKVLRIPVDDPTSLSSPDIPCRHWPVALGLHKINLLTHLYVRKSWFSCGTASEIEMGLLLGETKLEDSHSKSFSAALHQSKTAQGGYEIALAKHKVSAWHQIFCVTRVLQVYCRICPGSHCLWLVKWFQNQD